MKPSTASAARSRGAGACSRWGMLLVVVGAGCEVVDAPGGSGHATDGGAILVADGPDKASPTDTGTAPNTNNTTIKPPKIPLNIVTAPIPLGAKVTTFANNNTEKYADAMKLAALFRTPDGLRL